MTAAGTKFVAYELVSTARQGQSGLALEAQRKTIQDFARSCQATLLGCFTEIESGKNPDRPELAKPLHLAKVTGSTLVIAKLDRLSRHAAFLLTLRDSGVRFLVCDMPEANDPTVGIMELVAQAEREAISRRTKEALAAAKARGVKPGNPNGIEPSIAPEKGTVALRATVSAMPSALPPTSPRHCRYSGCGAPLAPRHRRRAQCAWHHDTAGWCVGRREREGGIEGVGGSVYADPCHPGMAALSSPDMLDGSAIRTVLHSLIGTLWRSLRPSSPCEALSRWSGTAGQGCPRLNPPFLTLS